MPRKTQDKKANESKNKINSTSKKKNTTSNIETSTQPKVTTSKKAKSTVSKSTPNTKSAVNDSAISKTKSKVTKKISNTQKKTSTKPKISTTATSKKSARKTTKKAEITTSSKNRITKRTSIKTQKVKVLEYYDLPYRYNETVVKILAQTPTTLFVYWDISDFDRQNLINQYGAKFFEETKPVLIIHNESNNYSFEIDINDFANSWYLQIPDSKSVYSIELGRRQLNIYSPTTKPITQNYLYIASSNKLEVPNNKILFNTLKDYVIFKNVKNNSRETFTLPVFIKSINKIYSINNIYDIYKKIYPEKDFQNFDLTNPSSGNPTSNFK